MKLKTQSLFYLKDLKEFFWKARNLFVKNIQFITLLFKWNLKIDPTATVSLLFVDKKLLKHRISPYLHFTYLTHTCFIFAPNIIT